MPLARNHVLPPVLARIHVLFRLPPGLGSKHIFRFLRRLLCNQFLSTRVSDDDVLSTHLPGDMSAHLPGNVSTHLPGVLLSKQLCSELLSKQWM